MIWRVSMSCEPWLSGGSLQRGENGESYLIRI